MKFKMLKIYIFLLLFLLFLYCQAPSEYKALKLKNGLHVYLIQKKSPVTSVVFRLKCGTIQGDPQLSALTNRMLLKGTEIRSAYQIFQEIESLGGNLDAEESKTNNLVFLSAPSNHFVECFNIFNECLCKPTFDNNLAAISELKKINESSDHFFYSKNLLKEYEIILHEKLYKNSPLENKNIKIEQPYSRAELKAFYQSYYKPSRAVMCIVGDFDATEVMGVVKSYWHDKVYEKKGVGALNFGSTDADPKYILGHEKQFDRVIIGYRAPKAFGENFYTTTILRRALGSGPNSILYQYLNKQSQYQYEPNTYYHYDADYGYFVIVVETEQGKGKEVSEKILSKITTIQEKGISENNFKIAKRKLISDISNIFQSSLKNAYMVSLATINGHEYFKKFPPYSEVKQLSIEDVNKGSEKLFHNPVVLIHSAKK